MPKVTLVSESVVSDSGTISPTFSINVADSNYTDYTSGLLKYFFAFRNRKVRITIEVMEEEDV